MKKAFSIFVYLVVLLLSACFIYYGNQYINGHTEDGGMIMSREEELDTLVFVKIVSLDGESQDETSSRKIAFTAKTLGYGDGGNKVIHGYQILNDSTKNTPAVSIGDKIVAMSYGGDYLFQDYYRFDKVAILGFVIAGFILLLGGTKGLNTIIALSLTCLSIFFVFIPSIKARYDIYLSTIAICLYIIIETLIIVYGLSKKSIITALSCTAGVIFSGIVSLFVDKWMKMTGYMNDGTYILSTLFGFEVNLKAIMFSMITIGALGAIMDVSMSVVSPLCELKESNPKIGAGELLKYGFSIGRDFMGTMTNTLILAYMGSSMIVVLVYAAYNYPLLSLLNKEEIVFEFLQSLVGSLGILLTIPLATVAASLVLSGGNEQSQYLKKSRSRSRMI